MPATAPTGRAGDTLTVFPLVSVVMLADVQTVAAALAREREVSVKLYTPRVFLHA